jgi:hypothetical protein
MKRGAFFVGARAKKNTENKKETKGGKGKKKTVTA